MSIFARSVREPSGNSPAFMRSNRSRFSSTERLRYGLSLPGSVSVPRYSRISLGGQVADVGLAGLDQLDGPLVELVEVVGGVEEAVVPVEAQPAHVLHDRIDVLLSLPSSGLVSSKRRLDLPPNSVGQAEVQADRLGVADVQVAVGLRRKARVHAALVLVRLQVVENDVADEIGRPGRDGVSAMASVEESVGVIQTSF